MTYDELVELENQLEKDAITASVENYRARLAEGLSNVHPGITLIKRSLDAMVDGINAAIDSAKAGRAGRAVTVLQFLDQFEPEVLAFAALRAGIDAASLEEGLTAAAMRLGSTLEMHVNYEQLRRERPDAYDHMMRGRHHVQGKASRWLVMRGKSRWAGLREVKWGPRERGRVGTFLLELVQAHAGIIEMVLAASPGRDQHYVVRFAADAAQWLAQAHAACEVQRPQHYPMVVPPLQWTDVRDGGYLNHRYLLVKSPPGTVLGDLDQQDMPEVLAAANTLQYTAYRINRRVLQVLKYDDTPLVQVNDPARPAGIDVPADKRTPEQVEEVRMWKRAMQDAYSMRARAQQHRAVLAQKVATAEKVAEAPSIYFPVVADWRGRMYYKAQPLNPQGDDVAKGLLQFAHGRPLGENGAYWLAVHLANSFGVDKVPFDERVQWVNENRREIIAAGMDPLGPEGGLWRKADAPYVFLSAAVEYAQLAAHVLSGEPASEFLSHTIVSMDGSCNGLQHLSALLRDPIGGAAVNLVPADRPSDIYTQVAQATSKLVEMDLADEELRDLAAAWVGKIDRSLVKRNTMTVPYAVTSYGMARQLAQEVQTRRDEGNDLLPGVKRWYDACNYLAKKNYEAICGVVVAARDVMTWLQECAKVAARADLPIYWRTPSGFVVVQAYRDMVADRLVTTLAGARVELTLRVMDTKLAKRRQASGVAPNFIHSLDAAHLVATVNSLQREGVVDFVGVHDSYGVHAGNVDLMHVVLREEFVRMYTPDLLEKFRDDLREQLPEEVAQALPAVPQRGSLDLEGVKASDYFFA
jgi:DNA-directed RNA polymerase